MQKSKIIISLGGSLVAPKAGKIATGFLKNFRHCISKYFDKYQFFIFVGGGKVCRMYQKVLEDFGGSGLDRDLIGIKIASLNAEIVKQVFADNKESVKVSSVEKFEPGHSTDFNATIFAKESGANIIINLTNIDNVFDKDPDKFISAKPLEKVSWPDFRKIVGAEWSPGLSAPFDPKASEIAEQLRLKVVIINGKHLKRLEDFLNNKKFIGTIIE